MNSQYLELVKAIALSLTELRVAELYCHGFIDKEVAERLKKPIWTIRTHKKHIYNKLGISSEQELVLYMVASRIGVAFDVSLLRKFGLDAIFSK